MIGRFTAFVILSLFTLILDIGGLKSDKEQFPSSCSILLRFSDKKDRSCTGGPPGSPRFSFPG